MTLPEQSRSGVPAASAPPAGAHGGEGPRLAALLGCDPAEVLDLSQSLNPVAPDVAAVVRRHLPTLRQYPEADRATGALAEAIGVPVDRLVLTNGGAEAIALVADRVGVGWVDEPDFSLYRRHLGELREGAPRFRSNPHSPSGALAGPDEDATVWDEAFYPLATGRWTRGDADRGRWVVGSLTKLFACPGLRMGYAIAPDPAEAAAIAARQPHWSVGSLACAVLPELLAAVDLPRWRDDVAALRSQLGAVLRARGYEPRPSAANWLLVDAPELRGQLAPHAIAVRDCASFAMPGVVRIAVPDAAGLEQLDLVLAAIAEQR